MRHLILCLFTLCFAARADIYITVTGASIKKAKLAITKLQGIPGAGGLDAPGQKTLADQVKSDLTMLNLFEFAPETPETQKDLYTISYEEWAKREVSFVLKLGHKVEGGKLVLEALLFDVPGQRKVLGTRYQAPPAQYPRLVHTLSEDILKALTGERGLFSSRILMVCRDLRKKNAVKEVFVVDPDGKNPVQLTFDGTLSLSPSWAPDGKSILYTQYGIVDGGKKRGTLLRKHNLISGDRMVLSSKEGMNSGGVWSPKGDRIAVTLSFNGRPEIYFLPPTGTRDPEPFSRNVKVKRLGGEGFQPNYPSLLFDVELSWAPDGKRAVFSSARSSHPMIYVADVETKLASQLTFAGTYNSSPDWSPRGDKILFAAQRLAEGNFDIYVIDPDGNNLARVTGGENAGRRKANSENPSWAPTGRHLAYAGNEGDGNYAIYIMSLDGSYKRRISPERKECFDPSWGPVEAP